MIKTIAFDLGEVVLTNDWHYDCPEKFVAFENFYGINYDQMERGWNEAWPAYELGEISENEFWTIFLKKAGAKSDDVEHAKALWKKYFGAKPGMFEILEKLKQKYQLIVISSTGKEWLQYKINKYELFKYFDFYITTCDTSMRKTEIGIFDEALRVLKLQAEELLFVDDNVKVIETAESIGIQTIRFENAKQLDEELTKMNI